MSKVQWSRTEHSILLRAWLEVAESVDARQSLSKAALSERVYHRFTELSPGVCKRTSSAMTIQKAVLAFNFNFIAHYNLENGTNAWVSLNPGERVEVYRRERTSYNFIDLDPSMMATMARIRKRLESEFQNGYFSTIPRNQSKGKSKSTDGDDAGSANATSFQAVIDEHHSYGSSGSSDDSGASDDSVSPSNYRTSAPRKRTVRPGRVISVDATELMAVTAAFKKTSRRLDILNRRLERLVADHSRRGSQQKKQQQKKAVDLEHAGAEQSNG